MRSLSAIVLAAATLHLVTAPELRAQDSLEQQIEKHLAAPPAERGQLVVPKETPIVVPESARRDLRFEFQRRMALTGHGVLYDAEGREVTLDLEAMFRLQEEMLNAVREEKSDPVEGRRQEKQRAELNEIIEKVEEAMRDGGLERADRFAAMNLLTRAEAAKLDDLRRSEYIWRSNYLMNAAQRTGELTVTVIFIDFFEWFQDWWVTWLTRTAYMNECAAAGVPIPPDFAISGTDWEFQGQLTTKLIAANDDANVWTWHRTGDRGACIALPRGDGSAGSLAGIICQSAETGNACFWDNLPRGGGSRIPWATETLVIRDLQDGSELAENCTGCHRGNNVFLLSPDDPTWCRLLRGQTSADCAPIAGTDIANFTLAVEATVNPVNVPNTSISHSRYTPYSGTPPRAGWENTETVGCGGVCHLGGSAVTPPPMPPACGVDCY